MGTSNLYGGPKKAALLPHDYEPNGNSETDHAPENPPIDEQPEKENPELLPRVTWSSARRSMSDAVKNRTKGNVKRVISNYTKALGGHTSATRQALKVRNTAGVIYSYFAGTPEAVRKKLEDAGVRFEGRTTNEIFRDICNLIAPVPNDLEDSLVNNALQKTFADIAADQNIDLSLLESFNEDLLQSLVGGLMKHYIFDKLIMQTEQTALKNCEHAASLRDLEKAIKQYIDGIVDSVVPDLVKSGINPADFNRVLETLCDISYQQMEDL